MNFVQSGQRPSFKIFVSFCRLSLFLLVLFTPETLVAAPNSDVDSSNRIVKQIGLLEDERDPKCYATASRLQDFMFGTPLANPAKFLNNSLQKQWVAKVWEEASVEAVKKGLTEINDQIIANASTRFIITSKSEDGYWLVRFPNQSSIKINANDKRQYSTIAYSLRAILSVQQESLLQSSSNLVPLSRTALKVLSSKLDLLNLSVLKLADHTARAENKYTVSQEMLRSIWNLLSRSKKIADKKTGSSNGRRHADLSLTKKIIDQKIGSYQAYNKVTTRLFNRNLQVYFAKMNWPKDDQKIKAYRKLFTETMIQFSFDLYKESERIALNRGHQTIQESDVADFVQLFLPHNVDEFEDSHFFPLLPKNKQITIESYDADSFRDNSAHWEYLNYAVKSSNLKAKLAPDPYALELMAENIALYGVLTLKMSGEMARKSGAKYLLERHYTNGLKILAKRVTASRAAVANHRQKTSTISSAESQKDDEIRGERNSTLFVDKTNEMGINFYHRISDWLSRVLRSYLLKSKNRGVLFIPPAFGGSGVAAGDINNDGYTDLLFLGGHGNKLYKNNRGKGFEDITDQAGLRWIRQQDSQPGEPRQPIIADLNNDGLQDIIITYVDDQHRVYKNVGGGRFADMTNISQLGGAGLVAGPATVADFNNDGLLDLYIGYFGDYLHGTLPSLKRRNENGLPNQLFINQGAFRFKLVRSKSEINNSGWTQALIHTDFDQDGLQDLIVGNDFGVNAYLRNKGDGIFEDLAAQYGTDKASYTMSLGIADLNQDLKPDIYVSNIVIMNKDEKYVLPNGDTPMKFDADKLANLRVLEANDLFLSGEDNEQTLVYSQSNAVGRGYSSTGWAWDAEFFDYDNDGDDDLYVVNGMNEYNVYTSDNPYFKDSSNKNHHTYMPVSSKESNVFFANNNGKLNNISKGSGIDYLGNSRSASFLDFDRDGDLDIAVNNFQGAAIIYQNRLESSSNRWVKLSLVGDVAQRVNRDAIGARIILTLNNGKTIWREVHGSSGYLSVEPKRQHFGLGSQGIKSIRIIWPNLQESIIHSIQPNHEYKIEQSKPGVITLQR